MNKQQHDEPSLNELADDEKKSLYAEVLMCYAAARIASNRSTALAARCLILKLEKDWGLTTNEKEKWKREVRARVSVELS